MVSDETKRPDEAAMRRILDRYSDSPEGIILRLAWLEGLSRKELNELTWDQVDFETQNLLLQDRTIPLEPSVAECLQKRYEQYSTISDRVVIADRGKKPMTLVNVSRLVKNALDSEGQDVALKDLRRDWVIRQIKANGWAYAARVSGMAVSRRRRNRIYPLAYCPTGREFRSGPCHLDVLEIGHAAGGSCQSQLVSDRFYRRGFASAESRCPYGQPDAASLEGDVGAAKRSTNRQSICSANYW